MDDWLILFVDDKRQWNRDQFNFVYLSITPKQFFHRGGGGDIPFRNEFRSNYSDHLSANRQTKPSVNQSNESNNVLTPFQVFPLILKRSLCCVRRVPNRQSAATLHPRQGKREFRRKKKVNVQCWICVQRFTAVFGFGDMSFYIRFFNLSLNQV